MAENKTNVKIASPLFILRQACEKDLFQVLEKLAALGFDGVEFLGLQGHRPANVKKKLEDLSLLALGNHVDYATLAANTDAVIRDHLELGCRYLTVAGPDATWWQQPQQLQTYMENVARIGKACRQEGIQLLYHNHAAELKPHDLELTRLEYLLDEIPASSLALEPDLGWIAIGGHDPAIFLKKYQDRCPVIHFKDYAAQSPAQIGTVSGDDPGRGGLEHGCFEFRPTGYGIVNTPALLPKALSCRPEWLVADHDMAYERDAYADLKLSLDYLRTLLALHQGSQEG